MCHSRGGFDLTLCLCAATKRLALSDHNDLEATTEESIECVSSSDLERSRKETFSENGKVRKCEAALTVSVVLRASRPLKGTVSTLG